MAYNVIDRRAEQNVKQDDMLASKRFVIERKPDSIFFYELEEAVVVDVVLDETHKVFAESNLIPEECPSNIDGSEPKITDKDYGWIGKIKFRFLNSEKNVVNTELNWATPIENTGLVEYPLMNEIVIVGKYMEKYFYTRKINANSIVNSNALIYKENIASGVGENLTEDGTPHSGPKSKMNYSGGPNYEGVLGSYFKFNPKIRTLRPFEGDTILQSRFGSSIRFGAYDYNRGNDNGVGEYSDRGGNPMILIRNRQATIKNPDGKTARGLTLEDINEDGSSIQITSGKTISRFAPQISTGMVNITKGISMPKLDGDQMVFNSGRIVFSSKTNEMLFFSKKTIGMTTDQVMSLNSYGNMTITSTKGVMALNAPKIYLNFKKGGPNDEPALLGRSTVNWMYALVDWMLLNVNSQIQTLVTLIGHFHLAPVIKITLLPAPPWLAIMAENLQSLYASQASLIILRTQLSSLMSSRVFLGG